MKFIFSQPKNPNFENFLEEHAHTHTVNGLRLTVELILVWKSHGKVMEFLPVCKVETLRTARLCVLFPRSHSVLKLVTT